MEVLHIYTRVSTTSQEDKGTSLASQKEIGEAKAKSLGFKARVWNEGGKSSNHEGLIGRPELASIVEKIRSGEIKHLFVYDQSRLSRNDHTASIIRWDFRKHGVTLYTKDGTYDFANPLDVLTNKLLAALAEYDNMTRAERSRLGKMQRVREGFWHGGPTPFGYRLENKRLVLEDKESVLVREIFERYAAGDSTKSIQQFLDGTDVSPRRGGLWAIGSIQALLKNTHYIGYYTYRDGVSEEEFTVECPPIVTKRTWKSVQSVRERILERRGQKNRTKHFYLLRDLMFCGHCGSPIRGRINESKHERFYYCDHKEYDKRVGRDDSELYSKKGGCGFSRSMNIDRADQLVFEVVDRVHSRADIFQEMVKRKLLNKSEIQNNTLSLMDMNVSDDVYIPDVNRIPDESIQNSLNNSEHFNDDVKTNITKKNRLLKEITKINTRIGLLRGSLETDEINETVYKAAKDKMENKIVEIEAEIEALDGEVKNLVAEAKWNEWFKTFGDKKKLRGELSPDQKKRYLEGFINRIYARFIPETNEHELTIMFSKRFLDMDLSSYLDVGEATLSPGGLCSVRLPARATSVKR